MPTETFGCAVNCMDGRVQEPVAGWVKANFGVRYVDMVTEAGPDGILAHGPSQLIESIRNRVQVSTGPHNARVVMVAGHAGCAGNPVSPEQHVADVRAGMHVVASWGLPVTIVGLWVSEAGAVEVVDTMAAPGA